MIVKVESEGEKKNFTAKGVITWEVKEGDMLELEGNWKTSSYTGEQEFDFRTACASIPEDSRTLLTYAVSLTPGLGPAIETSIWEKYGEKWTDALELDIPRIKEQTRFHWLNTLTRIREQKNQANAISYLLGKGCTLNMANAAWNMGDRRHASKASTFPVDTPFGRLSDFDTTEWPDLSEKALGGFIRRAREGKLNYPRGFLGALESDLTTKTRDAIGVRTLEVPAQQRT